VQGHGLGAEPETAQDLTGASLESLGVKRVKPVVDIGKGSGVGALLLEDELGEVFETLDFLLGGVDDVLESGLFAGVGLFGEEENIGPIGDGDFTVGDALEELGFTAAVGAEETVFTANGQLDGGVVDELVTPGDEGEVLDFDIAGELSGSEDTSDGAVLVLFGDVVLLELNDDAALFFSNSLSFACFASFFFFLLALSRRPMLSFS
jgi:hypothetical protein